MFHFHRRGLKIERVEYVFRHEVLTRNCPLRNFRPPNPLLSTPVGQQ